jgi:hypothetical protein
MPRISDSRRHGRRSEKCQIRDIAQAIITIGSIEVDGGELDLKFKGLGEARRWSTVNLSILVPNECKALINVCAMVRSVSL